MKNVVFALLIIISNFAFGQLFFEQANILGINDNFGFQGGGGISVADFNNDGFDDVTYCTTVGKNVLFFENTINGFTQIYPNGIVDTFESRQAVWVDVENDGDKDLFVTNANQVNNLYINDGNFNFSNETTNFGLPLTTLNTYGANFADVNNDGFLDLYISNLASPNEFYYYNTFTQTYFNISTISGANDGFNFSFCSVFFDYDFDGDLDLYTSNDGSNFQNSHFRNDNNFNFTNVSDSTGAGIYIFSMNTGIGDYNNDGFWDIYCTNLSSLPSAMLTGLPNHTFIDNTIFTNTTFNRFGWGANFFDFNNNTWQDLYVVGDFVNANNPAALYVNNQNGSFTEPLFNSFGIGGNDTTSYYSTAIADFNLDGYLDIFNTSKTGNNFKIYTNYNYNQSNFLKLNLVGTASNKYGLGSTISVYHNNQKRIFAKHCGDAFLSQNSDLIHIGFNNQFVFDSIVVNWITGNNKNIILPSQVLPNKIYNVIENNNTPILKNSELCLQTHEVKINPIPSQTYGSQTKTYSNSKILNGFNVDFKSENLIELLNGFEAATNCNFTAIINACE